MDALNTLVAFVHLRMGRAGAAALLGTMLLVAAVIYWWPIIAPFLGIDRAQAATYQMQTGYYVGDGASKEISGLGFTPELVIIKADTNAGTGAIMKTIAMPQNNVAYLGTGTNDDVAAQIQFTDDGFIVTGALSDTINARYTWVAFTGSDCSSGGQFCVGSYTGTGTATNGITTGFDPDLVWVKGATTTLATWRSSTMADNYAQYFSATAENTTGNFFTTLDATGFTVGATNNAAATRYYYVSFKEVNGFIDVGTYTGNGADNRDITGVGFEPDYMFTKQGGAVAAIANVSENYGDSSNYFTDTANLVNAIQALLSDGFQVGTSNVANANTVTYHYAAFGGAMEHAASGTFEAVSGTYTGNGNSQTITNLGFEPDLVIVTASSTQHAVFTTRMMGGDSTAYFANNVANFAGGITTLSPNSFSVGNHATVNQSGVEYHWTAYGNAWDPETHTGASDLVIGAYYGNNINLRTLTRLPFTPDMLVIKQNSTTQGAWRSSEHVGDSSSYFHALADGTNLIEGFTDDGFILGNATNVNANAGLYWYFGFATSSNFSVGTYSGTGAPQNIATPFTPDSAWVKHTGATQGVMRMASTTGSSSYPFLNTATVEGAIEDLYTSGFSLGTAPEANTSGANNYRYAVWRDTTERGTSTYAMQTGYYVGDGGAKVISGLGFSPDMVLIKADTTAGAGVTWTSIAMPQNNAAYLGSATANNTAGQIMLTAEGFRVAGANTNTANTRYTWIAFTGSNCTATGQFCVGRYSGDGAGSKAIDTGFTPDLVWTKHATSTTILPSWRSSVMPDDYAQFFSATAQNTAGLFFQTLNPTGFTVGSSNNANFASYYFAAFKETVGGIDIGSYVGNGIAGTSRSGVGFQPDWVFTKNSTGAVAGVYNLQESYGNYSSYFSDTNNLTGAIQLLESDGFQVGNGTTANGNGVTYYFAAFGGAPEPTASGTYSMLSGSYVGTGDVQTFAGLGFSPDLVIIKGNTGQPGVFSSRMMGGDSSAYLDAPSTNIAGAITALRPDSFAIGTDATVNSPGVTYHWTVFGNAWKPDTNSGATDFMIGAYYGNGLDSRDIGRLPFSPDMLAVKRNNTTQGVWRTSEHVGDSSSFFTATPDNSNRVQAFNPDGFEVGTLAEVNSANSVYWYFAFATSSTFSVGTYSGTGIAQDVSVGFTPYHTWVKHTGSTQAVMRPNTVVGDGALPFVNAAQVADAITGTTNDGFAVGTAAETNTSGADNYRYAAWKQLSLSQVHYHFRADDADEANASSLTDGVEDTALSDARESMPYRLRLEVSNIGAVSASTSGYRLEYAEKSGTCAATTGWTRVGDVGGAWEMFDSANLTDGDDTTNIDVADGGTTDENTSFRTPNGGVKDTSDETAPITIDADEFAEFEYAITPTAEAVHATTYCFRVTAQGDVLSTYDVYPEATFVAHLSATTVGSQVSEFLVPSIDQYVGGVFVVQDSSMNDTHAITEVVLTENGTVDASTGLENVELYYEYDVSAPYDCASESYGGGETQYGLTAAGGFSGPDGTATFAGSVTASGTQAVCLYAVLDVTGDALSGDTIELSIAAGTDITASGGDVVRLASTPLELSGTTVLKDELVTQTHFHWRLDNGSESGASSATGGNEDTVLESLAKSTPRRIRVGVSNEGSATSTAHTFRLEYAQRVGSCAATDSGWTAVDAVGGDWDMIESANLTDGSDTTNIAVGDGGVTDENTLFLTPNGGVKDTSGETAGIVLEPEEHTDLEYSVEALSAAVDGASYCFRVTDAGTPLKAYVNYPEVSIEADVLVSVSGGHVPAVRASSSDSYIAGTWVITDQGGSPNITTVTLTESGTIDAQAHLSNIRLYYDIDTSNPYNCASESYSVGDAQYGATSTSFSSANGTSTFNQTVGISSSATLCLYAVMDVSSATPDGVTIELSIADPSTDVAVSSGTVNPNSAVAPTGSTTVSKADLTETHYHWRSDDGNEAAASSKTGGVEDVPLSGAQPGVIERLRIGVSNEGSTTSDPTAFLLQYAEKVSTCAAVGAWQTVGSSGSHWSLSESDYLTDGNDTTNVDVSDGGISDENTTFLTPNGGVHENRALSDVLTFADDEFTELEYVIEPNTDATAGTTYCFRVSGEDGPLSTYASYPEATLKTERDFLVQRGVVDIANGTTSASIIAGTHYTAPAASTSAFIRITNALATGAGATSGGSTQNANNVTVSILDPSNIESGVTFVRSGSSNSTRIYWELVEYVGPPGGDNEIVVRAQERTTYDSAELTVSTPGAAGVVEDGQVVVFITGQENSAANSTAYHAGISTAEWNSGSDTATFTRGVTGSVAASVSYAIVEFTGANWRIQRSEHTYGTAGASEYESITPINSMSRAFLHTQKRTGVNQVDELGHQVWLESVGEVRFSIPTTAASPNTHVSVAWVVENTQTNGTPMVVTRTSGAQVAGGPEPSTYPISIGATLSAVNNASIFMTMWGLGDTTFHPRAIMGAGITSTSYYELWISDTGSGRAYRTEVVDWPTAELSFEQFYYNWYDNNDALDPTDPWPPGPGGIGENAGITSNDSPPTTGDVLRLRMSVLVHGASVSQGLKDFRLEYGLRETSCGAVAVWYETGDSASTTALWRGYNATPADGTVLSTNPPTEGNLNLSVSISGRAGTYEEANPTALNPYKIFIGETAEYDWILEANNVPDDTSYCFRMVEADGTAFYEYTYYPTLTTAGFLLEQKTWRWFGDEDALTPTVPLAATNTAPSDVSIEDALKLRVLVSEVAGKTGQGVKFKLQYSEQADFSTAYDVASRDDCGPGSRFCYFDGAGTNGATVTQSVLYGGDSCVAGVGSGCGTVNELPYTPDVVGEVGTTTTDSGGTTVMLQHVYEDPVFIVEAITGDDAGGAGNRPAAAVITATSTSSFTVRIQEPDDEADDHGNETVAYLVMERGNYLLPDGRRVDVNSTTTSAYRNNVLPGTSVDACTYAQSFDAVPVVLTALQSNTNAGTPDFLTVAQENITSSGFACSIEVPDGVAIAPTNAETIGWVAIYGGTFGNNGIDFIATSTSVSITGWNTTPWYEYTWPYGYFSHGPGIVASKQTRFGGDGGWVRYDSVSSASATFAMDEADGGNRTHTAESVGILSFSDGGVLLRATTSTSTFAAYATKEYEFTIEHYDAFPGRTYYFRLYDVDADQVVQASSTGAGYPSLATEAGTLSFTISGVASGSSTEGVVTDVTTTPTAVPFGSLDLGLPKTAAQRLSVTTNATRGYQVLAYEIQDLTAGVGATIADITSDNTAPAPWSTACSVGAPSCYGYHTGDDTLANSSTRFLVDDTFASMDSTPREVVFSSVPKTAETTDIIYRIRVGASQPAGYYESSIVYIVVPVF